jgi:DNA-binding response OmpR family regulator
MWYLYNDLLGEEYTLHRATNGRDALHHLVRVRPQLLILDWTLDDIRPWDEESGQASSARATQDAQGQKSVSGLEILRVVRKSSFKSVPIIMLTGHKGFHEKLIGKFFGADRYLTKPLNSEALVQAVHELAPPAQASAGRGSPSASGPGGAQRRTA